MNKLTLFVTGVIAGAVLAAGGVAVLVKPALPTPPANSQVRNAERALAQDEATSAALSQREAAIKAKLAELGPKAPNLDEPTAISKVISTQLKQRLDMKMNSITARVKLTPDEESAIRDIFDKDSQQTQDMASKMLSGQLSPDAMKKYLENQKSQQAALDQQVQNILTPAQYIDYQNAQNDDKKNQAQMQANAEMVQIQSSLQLTDAQKDQVFGALYQGYAQQAGADGAKPAFSDLDIDGQMDAKKAAMQAVLTPAQYATYSQFVDSQKQMYKAIIGGGAAAQK